MFTILWQFNKERKLKADLDQWNHVWQSCFDRKLSQKQIITNKSLTVWPGCTYVTLWRGHMSTSITNKSCSCPQESVLSVSALSHEARLSAKGISSVSLTRRRMGKHWLLIRKYLSKSERTGICGCTPGGKKREEISLSWFFNCFRTPQYNRIKGDGGTSIVKLDLMQR